MPTPKHVFLAALDCPTKGWRTQHDAAGQPSPGDQWRFHEGQEVQRLARKWLGRGPLLRRTPHDKAIAESAAALADPASTLLFEATFEADGCVARADALRRLGAGWELIEIKSGSLKADGKFEKDYILDAAFSCAVLQAAGVPIHRVSLTLVNAEYTAGAGDALITTVDVTPEVLEQAALFGDNLADIADTMTGDQPTPSLCFPCRKCDLYTTSCIDVGLSDPLFDIPRISEKKFEEFKPYGRIANLPPDANLTPNQAAIVDVLKSGTPAVDQGELGRLDALREPVYYLDFEAIAPAVPVFDGTRPYQKHPFQYSLHIRTATGALEHRQYLADPTTDWRRHLAEQLLDDLGTAGRIVVYSNYEEQVLKQVAAWFPDLEPRIKAVLDRLFDLEKVVKKGYIHPGFRGRTSIKKVLPVMAPEFSYDDLDVSGGEDAAAVFGFMWIGEYPVEDHARHRDNLLEYCKLDTLAMVRVHEGLEALRARG